MTRQQAQKEYDAALIANQQAAAGSDESLYLQTKINLDAARTSLIQAENLYPTAQEVKRVANLRYLANRGLDIS